MNVQMSPLWCLHAVWEKMGRSSKAKYACIICVELEVQPFAPSLLSW